MDNNPIEYAITTFDNPYNPFEEFVLWDLFDKEKGHCSNQKVARLANFSDEMTEKEMIEENNRAIDRLIELDFTNTYKRIARNNKTN